MLKCWLMLDSNNQALSLHQSLGTSITKLSFVFSVFVPPLPHFALATTLAVLFLFATGTNSYDHFKKTKSSLIVPATAFESY